ncbi:MAG: dihydroorotase family protein [Candidatus Spechtbacteria bacterium]|nr:dihydroorotase family protein [Candidatus Spechtbacteria bacterium]
MFEIRNTTLPGGQKETILIGGPKIVVINKDVRYADAWIDGEGLLALPGLIDPHVHFRTPGGEHKEDWEHGVRAAIAGGVTTVFDMPNTIPPLTTQKRLERKTKLTGERDIDYRFWFGANNWNTGEIKKVAGDPQIVGVKVYMGSSTGNLLVTNEAVLEKIFRVCAENNLIVGVHAEDETVMRLHRYSMRRAPEIEDHCFIHHMLAEVTAVRKALELQDATKCRLYFCHLTTPEAVELVSQAKQNGATVYAEVCPHHLWLSNERMSAPGPSKNFYKMNPPLRSYEQMQKLRQYVFDGLVDTVGSDHAPHTREEKMQKNYDDIPSGVPGVETTLPLIFQFVHEGKMSIDRFIRLTSANAADIFGLRHKGKIEVGYDADIALLDPKKEVLFRHQDMATKCGWTPYVAMRATGAVKFVVSRGTVLAAASAS